MEFIKLWILWSVVFLAATNVGAQNPSLEEFNSIEIKLGIETKHFYLRKHSSGIFNAPKDKEENSFISQDTISCPSFDIQQELYPSKCSWIMVKYLELEIEAAGQRPGQHPRKSEPGQRTTVECTRFKYSIGAPSIDINGELVLTPFDGDIKHNVYTYELKSEEEFKVMPKCLLDNQGYLVQDFKTGKYFALFCIHGKPSEFFRTSEDNVKEHTFENKLKTVTFTDEKGVNTMLVGRYVALKFNARV